jgi:hypothetical protein
MQITLKTHIFPIVNPIKNSKEIMKKVITYLGTADVAPARALSFSLLVFLTFYVNGGVMGAGV